MLDAAILESHLSALSFSEPQGFLVLADWLQSQQDPWGELIALQHAVASKPILEPEIAALIAKHAAAWTGTARCEWQLGFVRTVTIYPTEPTPASMIAALGEFFARPVARLCDGVVFAPAPTEFRTTRDWNSSTENVIQPYRPAEALLQTIPERVTRFGFGAWPATPAMAYVEMPELRELSGWLQRTTELTLVGNDRSVASQLLLPKCTKLALHCADLERATIESLLASQLPVLEHLTISFGGAAHCVLDEVYAPMDFDEDDPNAERYPPTFTAADLASLGDASVTSQQDYELQMLTAATNLPALRHLSLTSSRLREVSIANLARSSLLVQLTSLDLSNTGLNDKHVEVLLHHSDRFSHLRSLDLRSNQLTPKLVGRLATALPAAKLSGQNPGDSPTFYMRYVGTME